MPNYGCFKERCVKNLIIRHYIMHNGWLCKPPKYKEETGSSNSNGSGPHHDHTEVLSHARWTAWTINKATLFMYICLKFSVEETCGMRRRRWAAFLMKTPRSTGVGMHLVCRSPRRSPVSFQLQFSMKAVCYLNGWVIYSVSLRGML